MLSSVLEHTDNDSVIYTAQSTDHCTLRGHKALGAWSPVSETRPNFHVGGKALDKQTEVREAFFRVLQDTLVVLHGFFAGCLECVLAWSLFVFE